MKIKVPGRVTSGWVGITLLGVSHAAWAMALPTEPLLRLTSEEFHNRERGQADLLAWAREHREPAMDALFRHSREAADPEVRERCLAVLRELVNDAYLKEGEGYLGIRMQDEIANLPGDTKPRAVIRVIQVVADTAAQNAGIQPNDLIAGLGGLDWPERGASQLFMGKIRQLKPNSKVTLQVSRNGKRLDIQVTLGRRPFIADPLLFDERPVDLEAAERAAKETYFRHWLEHKMSQK